MSVPSNRISRCPKACCSNPPGYILIQVILIQKLAQTTYLHNHRDDGTPDGLAAGYTDYAAKG